MFGVARQFLSASTARITVIIEVGVAQADGCFQFPAVAEFPVIAVGKTGSQQVSLVADFFGMEEFEVTHIELASMCMQSYKMSVEFFGKPVTGLGLDEPVTPLFAASECPGIEIAGNIQCDVRRKSYFSTNIESCGYVIE